MFTLFSNYFTNVSGLLHIFSYTTTRIGFAMLFSFFFMLLAMPKFIAFSRKIQEKGQPIRENYLPEHSAKKGTPTMGGVMIIFSTILACLLCADFSNVYVLILLFVFLSFGLIGFADDLKKVRLNNTGGIKPRTKMFFQILFSSLAIITLNKYIGSHNYANVLTFPFFRRLVLDIGFVYTLFRIFVVIGSSNAVNLTDGLDGLASFPIMLVCGVFVVFAYLIGNIVYSKYLFFSYQAGVQEICVVLSAVIGSVAGFLWFNIKPAQIFMGDTGSLSLGGVIGMTAVILKSEFLLAIIGGIFVMETLSVILQVFVFKATKGKKRLFRMTPVHHHFEKKGWSEMQIVVRFWLVSIMFAIIGLSSLKIR